MKISNYLLKSYKKLKSSLTFRITLIVVVIFSISSFTWNYFLIKTTDGIVGGVEIVGMSPICTGIDCTEDILLSEFDFALAETSFQLAPDIEDQVLVDIQKQLEEDLYQSLFVDYLLLPIILGTLIGMIISRIVSKPLTKLNYGIGKLESSKHGYKVDTTGIDIVDKSVVALNQLSDNLNKVESLRDNLIADTSHELRTPVAAIYMQLQGLKDGVLELDKNNIAIILADLERLSTLIERMEEYTQYKAGKPLQLTDVDLAILVKEVEAILENKLKDSKLELVSDIKDKSYINADKGLLKQILINIIDNAAKYSKGSKVRIKYSNGVIKIKDNGIGVSKKELPFIFERFYRIEKSRSREHGGMGLGLAIVKEIVLQHGWSIKTFIPKNGGLGFKISLG